MTTHSLSRIHAPEGNGGPDFLPVPQLVQWMTTLRCGLSCPHCLAANEEHGFADMPLAQALDLVDQCADMGVEEFLLTGGEPLARTDLHLVIDHLRRRNSSYSINTAVCPQGAALEAMRHWPPSLAAVSLDGPAEFHDSFRGRIGAFDEALRALELFRSLGSSTSAGTTVTSLNYRHLGETFGIVARSAAQSWGLHLVVPEGRAARRKDLLLNRRQLRSLIRFVAARRSIFPVSMADEIGYLGDIEPLVRDEPLRCGAGRAQCVILPDGSVVPCTTLDRTTSAGNINQRPLADIWREGFAELRHGKPRKKCGTCRYESACRGGCWLMTRHGEQCYRELFHLPEAIRTAAGIAICLGTMAIGDGVAVRAETPAAEAAPRTRIGFVDTVEVADTETTSAIDVRILHWYADGLRPLEETGIRERQPVAPASDADADDPAHIFFTAFASGKLPKDTVELCEAIAGGLKSRKPSLSLAGLAWRALGEHLLDGPPPSELKPRQRQAVRRAMADIQTNAEKWQQAIYEQKLDPYLARGRQHQTYRFEMNKAMIAPPPVLRLARDTAVERWGEPEQPGKNTGDKTDEAVEQWLKRHPYGKFMSLKITVEGPAGTKAAFVDAHGEREAAGETTWGIFDILVTSAAEGDVKLTFHYGKYHWPLTVPSGSQISYMEALRLVYEQHREAMDKLADAKLGGGISSRGTSTAHSLGLLSMGECPFMLPAIRKLAVRPVKEQPGEQEESRRLGLWQQQLQGARWWLADFWLF